MPKPWRALDVLMAVENVAHTTDRLAATPRRQ